MKNWANVPGEFPTKERQPPGAELQQSLLHPADAFAAVWHPEQQQLAVALADGSCMLWDALAGGEHGGEHGREVTSAGEGGTGGL